MAEQRIVLVDNDQTEKKNIKRMLTKLGYYVIGETGDGLNALKMIRTRQPDLVIMDAGILGLDSLEVARIINEDKLAPVILFASTQSQIVIERAKEARVFALLTKPVDEITLFSTIELALANYSEIIKLETEVKELKETLENRKVMGKAKGILMETLGISEAEAFRRMQKQSMNSRISMYQVAEAVILTHRLKD